jgi:DNA repair protein RecN (Recombination protein N)
MKRALYARIRDTEGKDVSHWGARALWRREAVLQELHIRNFAIIDDLHLVFDPGLNVLTGETGAGKSIIIDAVGLLLGDRAGTEWVRAGTDRAEIEATFCLASAGEEAGGEDDPAAQIRETLETEGLDDPNSPEILILSREVRLNGRNVCRVNGRAVSLQVLSDIGGQLVDIHGQGEHLNLLRPRTHVDLLDRYAGLFPLRRQVGKQVQELQAVRGELSRLRRDARTLAQRVDLLSFQVEEISAARLRPGEDGDLEHERRRLGNAEALMQLAQSAQGILSQGDGDAPSAIDLVSEAVGRLDRLARIDPSRQNLADLGQVLLEQLSDLAREVQDYGESLEYNPERLAEVEERLELIHNLKRKYGDTIEEVIAFGARAQAELADLGDWEVKTASLEAREDDLLRRIGQLVNDLSERRQVAGAAMARHLEAELVDLKMGRTRFQVEIGQTAAGDGAYWPGDRRVAFDRTGADRVEFLISTNPGEPLKPLAKVASGGETSRLMLALKSVLAHADATPTLIFDEIDQGIGGRVGAVVGRKLWYLTGHQTGSAANHHPVAHQVLCITHLPQLAVFGDQHLTVDKRIYEDRGETRTATVVRQLEGDERVTELMQMLGATTEAGRRSVEEMLTEVAQAKKGN